jgi:hypothetical protein
MTSFVRTLSIDSGKIVRPVPVKAYEPFDDRGAWRCNYSIGWPEGEATGYGMGCDAIQALRLAFGKIAIDLYASQYHKAKTLCWQQPGEGYGFPLPYGNRDIAVGYDKEL